MKKKIADLKNRVLDSISHLFSETIPLFSKLVIIRKKVYFIIL